MSDTGVVGGSSWDELEGELDRYERELLESGLRPLTVRTYVGDARRFVEWLRQGKRRVQQSEVGQPSRVAPRSRASRLDGVTSAGVPASLRELTVRWREHGRPVQPGIAWPRDRWITAFPDYAEDLRELPDRLGRRSVANVARSAAEGPDEATRAFVVTMAWGFGNVGYGPYRATRILAGTPDAPIRLAAVASTLAKEGAIAAYGRLANERDGRLRRLGPSFGTKFLYFVQPDSARPRALILDELVAAWFARNTDIRLDVRGWSTETYHAYLDIIHAWADELGTAPDDVEYAAFQSIATERGGQWALRPPGASKHEREDPT